MPEPKNSVERMPNSANRIPWWWPLLVSASGIGIAIFEAINNYQNWPVSGLAGSMILGGLPAWAVDAWIRGRSTPMGG